MLPKSMYSEKFVKNSIKILTISCNVLIRRVLKGKLVTQRALKALKGHLGTRVLRALGHSKGTQALGHLRLSRHFN